MKMERISYSLREMLVRQGIEAGRAANTGRHGMKGRGAASDGAHSQLETGNLEGGHGYPPIGRQGGAQPMGNSGKGRAVNAPAQFTGLHVIVDNSRCMPLRDPTRSAQRGSGIHLVLI